MNIYKNVNLIFSLYKYINKIIIKYLYYLLLYKYY